MSLQSVHGDGFEVLCGRDSSDVFRTEGCVGSEGEEGREGVGDVDLSFGGSGFDACSARELPAPVAEAASDGVGESQDRSGVCSDPELEVIGESHGGEVDAGERLVEPERGVGGLGDIAEDGGNRISPRVAVEK